MKRRLALLTALVLVLTCARGLSLTAGAQDISSWSGPTGKYTTVAWPKTYEKDAAVVQSADEKNLARMYTDPDTESDVLFVYYNGVPMEVLETLDGGWLRVRLEGMEGFMRAEDLVLDRDIKVKSKIPQLTINSGRFPSAPLMSAPDAKSKTLSRYPTNVLALVLGYADGWCHVSVNKKIGFMQSSYLWTDTSSVYIGSGRDDDDYDDTDYVYVAPQQGTQPSGPYYSLRNVGEWSAEDDRYNAAVYNPNSMEHLNLREEPDELSESLGKYYNGARVIVNYVMEGYGWANVTIGTLTGYMRTDYLEMGSEAYYPRSVMPLLYVAGPYEYGAYLLEYPTGTSRSIGMYANGTPVTVMGYSNNWLHVIIEGQIGFIQTDFAAYTRTSNVQPVIEQAFSWGGPVGSHAIAGWPLGGGNMVVANPNPKDRLNLRTAPSKTAGSKGKYYNGVELYATDVGDGWYEVTIVGTGVKGYMDGTFLASYCASAMPVLYTTSSVHLRAGMSTKTKSLTTLAAGTPVILMGFTSQWAHVIVNGQTGFIYAKYLK